MDRSKKILIVDDEIAFLYPIKKMMQKKDLAIDIADNAEQAKKLLESNSYDAIIVDVRLSGSMDCEGLSLLHSAKTGSPETKVIIMTGYGEPKIMKHAYASGADYYFEKPVAFKTLTNALQTLGVL